MQYGDDVEKLRGVIGIYQLDGADKIQPDDDEMIREEILLTSDD